MTRHPDNEPPIEVSSPVCSMDEADDAYMGYAPRDELIAFLTEMLEAERAGARVVRESARLSGDGLIVDLTRIAERAEARWTAMLLRHIEALGATPSGESGTVFDQAIAMPDLIERITFGQRWVVRRLREMLPRVRDNRLHSDLSKMLRSHEADIALVEACRHCDG